ncbi:AI-2E family transporter [Granulosicoccus sp.]|nr:AI-2E family transporter [Granulosicoccus sp.]
MQQSVVNRGVLILILVLISFLFLRLLQPFLQPIFIAALFAALFYPLFKRVLHVVGDRRVLASALTLIIVLFFIVVPLGMLLGVVTSQAVDIAQSATPWIRQQIATPGQLTQTLENLPFFSVIEPYRDIALERLGTLAGFASGWIVDAVQKATLGTVSALVSVLIMLYTMFFFLIDGDRLLYYVLYYLPLNDEDETKLLIRFTSVTRATLKGTAVIGVLQGSLAGTALYVAGIPSALFWAVAMMVLSVVPAVGTALVWIPAVIYLMVGGEFLTAFAVAVFCGVVVGTVDNLVRPKLVGNDTQLHELMIFFSTLGGLLMFGFMGFVIGPIIAALFVTIWELYGDEFQDWLPTTAFRPHGDIELPHERFERIREEMLNNDADAANDSPGNTDSPSGRE